MDIEEYKEDLPYILLVTSQECGHCINFRGKDGQPSLGDEKQWNYRMIQNLLNIRSTTGKKAAKIIEINLSTMDVRSDNIIQVNEYFLQGKNIIRLSISRRKEDKITFDVDIITEDKNKKFSKRKDETSGKKEYENFILETVPDQIYRLIEENRKFGNVENLPVLEEEPSNSDVAEIFEEYYTNPKGLWKAITDKYDNFLLWQVQNIPRGVKLLIPHYPAWMFVSCIEWGNSLVDNFTNIYNLYLYVMDAKVVKNSKGKYTVEQTSSQNEETKESTLENILNGKIKLHN